ncbi:MAG TPA: hypothetical protein VGK79_17310 [Gaiellaceae bacterium]
MGLPVVHFEIGSAAASELREFYASAFGWKIDVDAGGYADIRTEGTCPGTGFPGIDGGIAPDSEDFVTFYVQVSDVAAAPAMFADPRGNRIGLVRAALLA